MITRDEAIALLTSEDISTNLFNHLLQTEAVMHSLALQLKQQTELWAITGLLHDLDYQRTDDPSRHGILSAQMLTGKLPQEGIYAIKAHNGEMNLNPPKSTLDYALRCGETVTGLISANALIRPQGIRDMKPGSLKKKMKDKNFAANVNREKVRECENIGLQLDEFLQTSISAIEEIADQVGLES